MTGNFIKQSDIQGRLRLFRYGLVVLVVVTFVVTLLAPYAFITNVELSDSGERLSELEGYTGIDITAFLTPAILATVVVAVLGVALYFGYSTFLGRMSKSGEQK